MGYPDPREALRAFHRAGIAAVEGRAAVARALNEPSAIPHGPFHLLAIGKAAVAMAHGVADQRADDVLGGRVVTRCGYADADLTRRLPVEVLTAPHPVPDERSLAAGQALVDYLDDTPNDARFVCLISGGASSLVEQLADGADPQALSVLNEWLLGSGLDIGQMNRIRTAVSGIKGGRLGARLRGRRADVLLISDVPGDDPAVIGSGLFFGQNTPDDPAEVIRDLPVQLPLPPPPPAVNNPALAGVHPSIIASNRLAREAVAQAAQAAGWAVSCSDQFIEGEASVAGQALAEAVVSGPPGITIWGGEPTVTLPANPGRGGRMQTLALAAASVMADTACCLLAAGTDGADGPGEDAGAVIDGGTLQRGMANGDDPVTALAAADAGHFLAASGDLIQTGPTGTNVMDLVIGLKS